MQVALVIGLVTLFLVTATVTVVAQDRRARHHAAKRRRARLARLGEPVPRLRAQPTTHPRNWFGR